MPVIPTIIISIIGCYKKPLVKNFHCSKMFNNYDFISVLYKDFVKNY